MKLGKLFNVLKGPLAAVASTFIPGGPAVLSAVNAILPNDKKLPETATGQEIVNAVDALPPEQRASLMEKEVDLVAGSATDALIERFELTVLEDDRLYFPPYDAAPVYRPATVERYPALGEVLQQIADQIDERAIRRLNLAVDIERRSEREVVRAFLVEKGWISP